MKIADIQVGSRVRKESGDIQSLADSISRHGLLHPVVVTAEGLLVAGKRRLEAAGLLGWAEVPVTIVNVDDLLSAERDENEVRKDFTPTEAVAIGRLIEEQHAAKVAAQRQSQQRLAGEISKAVSSGDNNKANELRAQLPPVLGQSRTVAAKALGMSESSYQRAKTVVTSAEANPTLYGDLPAEMDRTGNIAAADRERHSRSSGKAARRAVHRKTPLPKPNLAVERAIAALGGICLGLEEIDPQELDPEKTAVWSAALKNSASILSRIARRMHVQ